MVFLFIQFMVRILFVCLGNICRSPLAEAIFNQRIMEMGLQKHFQSNSRGTANYHIGVRPDSRTLQNALKNGISIHHAGRQFDASDFDYDLILPMDRSNESNLLRLSGAGAHRHKIRLMRSFDPIHTGADVPDPYYGSEKDFQEVFDILQRSVKGLIGFLETSRESNS